MSSCWTCPKWPEIHFRRQEWYPNHCGTNILENASLSESASSCFPTMSHKRRDTPAKRWKEGACPANEVTARRTSVLQHATTTNYIQNHSKSFSLDVTLRPIRHQQAWPSMAIPQQHQQLTETNRNQITSLVLGSRGRAARDGIQRCGTGRSCEGGCPGWLDLSAAALRRGASWSHKDKRWT